MALTELTNRRTKTMKVFEKAPNERLYRCHVGNIHYPDSSKIWQDIDTTLMSKAGGFYQDKCFYNCEVPDLASGEFKFFNRDHSLNLKVVDILPVGYIPIPDSEWGNLGKGIQYTNAFGDGIHFEVTAKNMKFDKQIRFDKPPPKINKDFIVTCQLLELPSVWEIEDPPNSGSFVQVDIDQLGSAAFTLTDRIIRLHNEIGAISYIWKPGVHDSSDVDTKRIKVGIKVYKKDGIYYLEKIIPKEIFQNAVYPIFADDPVRYDPVTTGDGWIENTSYEIWATSRGAASGSHYHDPAEPGFLTGTSNTIFKIFRGFLPVDTSGIADGDTVTAAIVYIYSDGMEKNHKDDGIDYLAITQTTQADPASLADGDFDTVLDTEGHDAGEREDYGALAVGGYETWNLNATGLGWVNKTGYTKLAFREGHDIQNSEPTGIGGQYYGNVCEVGASARTGTAQDPYLDVTAEAVGEEISILPRIAYYNRQLRN